MNVLLSYQMKDRSGSYITQKVILHYVCNYIDREVNCEKYVRIYRGRLCRGPMPTPLYVRDTYHASNHFHGSTELLLLR